MEADNRIKSGSVETPQTRTATTLESRISAPHTAPGQRQIHQPARLQSADKQMSSQVRVNAGPRPRGRALAWGQRGGGAEVEAALISAAHDKGSPSDSSLLARAKFFINALASTPSHRHAGEKTLTEKKKKNPHNSSTADAEVYGAQQRTIMTHLERSTTPLGLRHHLRGDPRVRPTNVTTIAKTQTRRHRDGLISHRDNGNVFAIRVF